ncbi:MAG: transcriptional regulator, partial [Chloroflexi bacterium]
MIEPADVKKLLKQPPGETLAFASEEADLSWIADTLAAFANGRGGVLILGVSDSGRPRGLSDPETVLDRTLEAVFSCDPPLIIPLPAQVTIDGKTLLVVEVPPGLPHVYQAGHHYPVRQGAENVTLSTRDLRRLMLARGQISYERQPAEGAKMFDIDWPRVAQYVDNVPALAADSEEDALLKRGCVIKDEAGNLHPTNAGILLFGRDPSRFIPSAEIIVVRYAGLQMTDTFVREDIQGPLPDQIRRAEAFVVSNLQRSYRLDGLARTEYLAFPLDAVRELIVNAVAHRAYDITGDSIRIFIFADRLECYSPGRLPGHVTVDNIVTERFSRNEAIVQVLSDMGFIERLGYGIDRIIRRMAEEGLPPPQFEETSAGFKVTLYSQPQDWRPVQPAVTDNVRRWLAQGLNERQIKAMNFVLDHGRITNSDYSELCPDVSSETLRRDLADLVER